MCVTALEGESFPSYKYRDAKIQTGEALDKRRLKYSHTLKLLPRVMLF